MHKMYIQVDIQWGQHIWGPKFLSLYMADDIVKLQFASMASNETIYFDVNPNNFRKEFITSRNVNVYLSHLLMSNKC